MENISNHSGNERTRFDSLSIYRNEGDTLEGVILIFEGRKYSKPRTIRLTGKHRGSRIKLYNGKCWIEKPISI
ncbi:hypothetical protein LCGC14_1977280 [marine sediment metagenome]|uniref:Uncharacterized protein n=1 Tax=marine sediment metagenome TaxID=412755 RepID=A0A0F9HNA9_9ZZZZ